MSAPDEPRATEGATYRCEGCGEWLDEADVVRVQGSYTGHEVASRGPDGYPTPDLCGPVSRLAIGEEQEP